MTGKPFALDYAAVMAIGAALGADMEMLADVLPSAEAAIVAQFAGEDGED
jgi:hypothetical protein